MTATADLPLTNHRVGPANIWRVPVVNGDIVYAGTLVGLGMTGHAGAGYLVPYTSVTKLCPIGFALDAAVTGDSSASPKPAQSVDIGGGVHLLTVVGIAGTQADLGKRVWATADDTFSLVEQDAGYSIGVVLAAYSSTQVYVLVHPASVLLMRYHSVAEPDFTPTPTPTPTPT